VDPGETAGPIAGRKAGEKNFSGWSRRKPLERLDVADEIQRNPRKSKGFSLIFFGRAWPSFAGIWLNLDRVWRGGYETGSDNMKEPAKKPPRTAAEKKLDEEIEESFPASDPPSNTPTSAGGPQRAPAKRKAKGKPGRRG
jgi:hypothetical protein